MTDPFRYTPDPLVIKAAREVADSISSNPMLEREFSKGKMIGVLIYRKHDDTIGHIAAFSGNVAGTNHIEGFVPPIYDLLDPDGYFKKEEARLNEMSLRIKSLSEDKQYKEMISLLEISVSECDEELGRMKADMKISKKKRDEIRATGSGQEVIDRLIRQSQHEKAEYRRLKTEWESKIDQIKQTLEKHKNLIDSYKNQRAELSDHLQKWIFSRFIVHNALGESCSIGEIFGRQGLIPPGGTGECAAPKLLEHAYRNSLEPLAMGEFWYGKSSDTAVRIHGHFYPSCTSKCGPLLGYMMQGLNIEKEYESTIPEPLIIYEDEDIIIVEKPSGMPSVPGLNGMISLEEHLAGHNPHSVHRLDMDTSGIMVFARNETAANHLRRQFEDHTVRKTYIARLTPYSGKGVHSCLTKGAEGRINLPICPDYDERPRQKADRTQGKHAVTDYRIEAFNEDGTTDIILHPVTGRTHQLRVHCAHAGGLGRAILGDKLYGGCGSIIDDALKPSRLHLHALGITFIHPGTGTELTFESRKFSF